MSLFLYHFTEHNKLGKEIVVAIYLTSDWHLIKCQQGRKPEINENYEMILENIRHLEASDTLYFLGDLMDDTVDLSGSVKEILDKIAHELIYASAKCYFIRGNNDIMSDQFYINMGWEHVSYAEWVETSKGFNILLSHTSVNIPESHPEIYNIHGHIHRAGTDPNKIAYYHKCDHNINLCTANHREYMFTNIEHINIIQESNRNHLWTSGSEKPGMSQLCQNMATQVLEEAIHG